MKEAECIAYRETSYFSRLIIDYLDQKPELAPFVNDFPSLAAFKQQIERKSSFTIHQRKRLSTSLKAQYASAGIELDSALEQRINALELPDTYTVTTGHQLNILTGPLFFIYKIFSTINLAERLAQEYPEQKFQPIFWMATEDHDFDEISFINLFGGKLRWKNDLKGAVGRMPTFGFGKVLDELEEHLGPGKQAAEILTIFRKAYHDHDNLAQATRYIAHTLFAEYGLLILDGDDADLKRSMIPHFKKDLFEGGINQCLKDQSKALSDLHFAQIFPRDINLFYLGNGCRERIEKREGRWYVLNTDLAFDQAQLENELEQHPERFSPNVALRPLYQEHILPNLAYIGGGGEIAYWLQLKTMFDHCEVPYPLPMLRNSVLFVEQKWQNRLADLELNASDLFIGLDALKKEYLAKHFPDDLELERFDKAIEKLFADLEDLAQTTDKSMLGAVKAQRQKQLNGMTNLRKKLLRAEKRRHKNDMEKIDRIYYSLFPNAGLQERHDNLSYYYAAFGRSFLAKLKAELDPLDFCFSIIKA